MSEPGQPGRFGVPITDPIPVPYNAAQVEQLTARIRELTDAGNRLAEELETDRTWMPADTYQADIDAAVAAWRALTAADVK